MSQPGRPVLVVLLLALNACYSYVPTPAPEPARGAPIRAQLSTPGSFALGDLLIQNVTGVEGEVIGWTGDSLAVSALRLTSAAGQEFLGQGQTVYLPGPHIQSVAVKRISAVRTGLLVGAGAVLAVVTGLFATGDLGSDPGPGGGGGPSTQ